MLTEEQIIALADEAHDKWNSEADRDNQWDSLGHDEIFVLIARAIESAVRAEYADVPPEKWKALYLVACDVRKNVMKWAKVRTANHLADATFDIDNGTYNPKIGGEE